MKMREFEAAAFHAILREVADIPKRQIAGIQRAAIPRWQVNGLRPVVVDTTPRVQVMGIHRAAPIPRWQVNGFPREVPTTMPEWLVSFLQDLSGRKSTAEIQSLVVDHVVQWRDLIAPPQDELVPAGSNIGEVDHFELPLVTKRQARVALYTLALVIAILVNSQPSIVNIMGLWATFGAFAEALLKLAFNE